MTQCPYGDSCQDDRHWYVDENGRRIHDPEGLQPYLDEAFFGDAYGAKLPDTPYDDDDTRQNKQGRRK